MMCIHSTLIGTMYATACDNSAIIPYCGTIGLCSVCVYHRHTEISSHRT